MTLVERFIQFNGWPISRKSALLYGLALPFHIFCTLASDLVATQIHWIDRGLMDRVFWSWNAEIAVCFLISLTLAWRGFSEMDAVDERGSYGLFMVTSISLFGFASTAFAVWFPSVIVLVAVWYSPRAGIYAFLYGIGLTFIYSALLFSGKMPYAPALLDRSIDVQNSALWTFYVFLMVLLYFAFCLFLVVLLISAQQLQQRRLNEAQIKLDRSNRQISRYVPSQLTRKIAEGEYSESFTPERLKLTMLFSDIEGFTEASDHLDPEDLAALLNEYLSEMMNIAEAYGATVNQIVGDGIMMFFGAPQATTDEDHALRAVRMALEMQRRMTELKDVWIERGISKPFRIRIGINTGYSSVGDYGSPGRKLYSAIGVQTNLTDRIQALREPGKVLMSYSTWVLVQDQVPCVAKGEVQFKGLHGGIKVYEVVGD